MRREEWSARLGIGTEQVDALRSWARLLGLATPKNFGATGLGLLVASADPYLRDECTWWTFWYRLGVAYAAWKVMGAMGFRAYDTQEIDELVRERAREVSPRTIRSARLSVLNVLSDTPLGQELGLVRLESDGKRVTGLVKLPVRYGTAPMAAVAYALLDWAEREQVRSAALETLAAPDGPGAILHMSEGVLERYLLDIDGAFRGRVLTYSRTAGLNEAYFKREVTPLQVLAAHYIRQRDGVDWPEALARAEQEVTDTCAPRQRHESAHSDSGGPRT